MSSQRRSGAGLVLPRLDGRRCLVTGGAAGIGYFTAERLAGLGAEVIITARRPERAARAIDSIRREHPNAQVRAIPLDLARLASVEDAASQLQGSALDGIVANAGVLPWDGAPPTADGFEPAFGTNQLGHFALLARLFPMLTRDAGVVQLGSLSALGQRLRFDDLMHDRRRASRYTVYGRSKLAVMTTAVELDRRLTAAGSTIRSVIAHPGFASGAIDPARPGIAPERSNALYRGLLTGRANSKQQGAEITVAALLLGVGGECWGPDGAVLRLGGGPARARIPAAALDPVAGARLWAASEALTGVDFRVG